jgi:hypothetical protein
MMFVLILGILILSFNMDSLADAAIGFVVTFITLRLFNFVFNSILLCAQNSATVVKILARVTLVIIYIGSHAGSIMVTLEMVDDDFMAWTGAFFIGFVLEVVVWELLVICWQHRAVGALRKSEKPMMGRAVSSALRKAYVN